MAAVAQNESRRPWPIAIDTEAGVVALDRIFIHRSAKGFVCVGIGAGGALLERAARTFDLPAAKLADTTRASSNDLYLERLALLAKGYNPDEARVPAGNPGGGQWTIGGVVASAASAAASLFETDSASVVAGLATIGSRLSAPTAFLGTLFIPTNRSPISNGTLPNNPDVSYRFDSDTGTLTLTRSDGTVIFSAHHGAGGVFRDSGGNAIGRMVDGALILDPHALPSYAASSKPSARSGTGAQAQAQTKTDRNEPKLCPDPSNDRPGSDRSPIGVAYQIYINTLINPELPTPPGMAVKLYNPASNKDVYFDDCRHTDGTMIEAKGPGYARLIEQSQKSPWFKHQVDNDLIEQADRQFDAAQSRPIEWYFAEKNAADYVRKLFEGGRLSAIKIIHMPMPR